MRTHLWASLAFAAALSGAAGGGSRAQDGASPLWRTPLEALTETRERPMFTRTRRPPPPPPVAAAPPPPPPPPPPAPPPPPEPLRATLLGVVTGPDEAAVAVLRDDEQQAVKRLQTGEILNGWTLQEVRRREVVLRRDQETMTIEIPPPGAQPAAPAVPQIPARSAPFPMPGAPPAPGVPPPAGASVPGKAQTAAPFPTPNAFPQAQSMPFTPPRGAIPTKPAGR